jgi:hypothetical protein
MDKESVIKLMLEKFLEGNRYLGKGSGMPEEEVEAKISEGLVAMEYLLSEVYDEFLANNLLK